MHPPSCPSHAITETMRRATTTATSRFCPPVNTSTTDQSSKTCCKNKYYCTIQCIYPKDHHCHQCPAVPFYTFPPTDRLLKLSVVVVPNHVDVPASKVECNKCRKEREREKEKPPRQITLQEQAWQSMQNMTREVSTIRHMIREEKRENRDKPSIATPQPTDQPPP